MLEDEMRVYPVPYIWEKGKFQNHGLAMEVPGSKSITNRVLLLAVLANGKSILKGVLFSDDSRHFLSCLQKLGFEVKVDEEERTVEIQGLGGFIPKSEASIYVGSAGTAARFLAAWLGVSQGIYHMNASPQMQKRPMGPLLETLRELGCEVTCTEREGYFPFTLKGNGFESESIRVNIDISSQFLSGLLMAAPLSEHAIEIQVEGSHGLSYVEMTIKMMEQFGVEAGKRTNVLEKKLESEEVPYPILATKEVYHIEEDQSYHPRTYQIEPDISGACYFYAMAPLLGMRVLVKDVFWDSLQGDVEFLRILEKMGCITGVDSERNPKGIWVHGRADGSFEGADVDMSTCSDQAITLAALAPFANGPTTIRGIGHIRYQETDRLRAISTELKRMGIRCEEHQDSITIHPGIPQPALIQTYEDHRMAMGFSLVGLRAKGIVIDNPLCCKKTFENYFALLDKLAKSLKE